MTHHYILIKTTNTMDAHLDSRKAYLLKVMIIIAISFIWTMLLILPVRAEATTGTDDQPFRVEEFTVTTPGHLKVNTSGGHIEVTGSESDRVRVEMYVHKNGRNLTPDDTDLDDYDIRIEQEGNTVIAEAKRRGSHRWFNFGNHTSISFVVYTPRDMATDLNTSGGHIEAGNLNGRQNLDTSGGHINMHEINGTVDAHTSGGHIEIHYFDGTMKARTSGGHIDADNATGKLTLRTSGGHIDLEKVAGSIEARTSGGSITADVDNIEDYLDLSTSGGSVNVTVPGDMGLDLELRGNRVNTKLNNFSGSMERNRVEGSINGGGPKLKARTSGGSVNVTFRHP